MNRARVKSSLVRVQHAHVQHAHTVVVAANTQHYPNDERNTPYVTAVGLLWSQMFQLCFFFLAVVDDPPARNQIMRVCILLQRINPARSLDEDQPTWKLRKEGILYCSKRERLQRFFLAHKSLALLAFPFLLPHYWSAVVKSEPILSRPYCDKPEVVLSVACAHAPLRPRLLRGELRICTGYIQCRSDTAEKYACMCRHQTKINRPCTVKGHVTYPSLNLIPGTLWIPIGKRICMGKSCWIAR